VGAAVNPRSALPLNRQAEQYLRAMIEQEPYRAGALLPNEVELAQALGVARNTVRTAMDRLVREGLLERKKGVGTRVKRAPIATELNQWKSFTLELGDRMTTLRREVFWEPAEAEVASALGLLPGEKVCRLERLKGEGDEPMALLVSYFPRELGIRPDETFEGRLYEILEQRYGVAPADSLEEIGAMAQSPRLTKKLNLPQGVPILFRKRRVLDRVGRLIELAHAFYRADRFVYRINLHSEEKDEYIR
jgi:GntR family transcriptional regulator